MVVENQYNAGRFRIFYILSGGLTLLAIGYYLLVKPRGVDLYIISVLAAIAFPIYIFLVLKNYYFIHFDDKGEELSVKYMHVHPFIGSKKSVVIPTRQFHKFEVQKKMGGLQPYLFLYQKTNRGIAKYPGICISGLSANDYRKLTGHLQGKLKR